MQGHLSDFSLYNIPLSHELWGHLGSISVFKIQLSRIKDYVELNGVPIQDYSHRK